VVVLGRCGEVEWRDYGLSASISDATNKTKHLVLGIIGCDEIEDRWSGSLHSDDIGCQSRNEHDLAIEIVKIVDGDV
jgi:hypothetical protein